MRAGPRVSRVSILNDVLGPVMRGPSSSHTAGSYHIAKLVTGLLGAPPVGRRASPSTRPARMRRSTGSRAWTAPSRRRSMGWDLTDDRFSTSLDRRGGGRSRDPLRGPAARETRSSQHRRDRACAPPTGARCRRRARSIGGGAVEVVEVDGWPVRLTGYTWEVLVDAAARGCRPRRRGARRRTVSSPASPRRSRARRARDGRRAAAGAPRRRGAGGAGGARCGGRRPRGAAHRLRQARRQLFQSAAEMLALAEARGWSLGRRRWRTRPSCSACPSRP